MLMLNKLLLLLIVYDTNIKYVVGYFNTKLIPTQHSAKIWDHKIM